VVVNRNSGKLVVREEHTVKRLETLLSVFPPWPKERRENSVPGTLAFSLLAAVSFN
jgi:hypothetical protein